jgi:succinoglycan biosynthesis protein ExoM
MPHFIVTICTARRPQMLLVALKSLVKLSVPEGGTLSVAVIENDLTAQSLSVIEEIRKFSLVPVSYYLESKMGIPEARNRSIEAALSERADWVAMIDDDEYVEPDWLLLLYNGCLRYKADVATGPVRQISDGIPPHWWKPVADSRNKTGELRRDAYTNNVLFHSRLIALGGLGLKFDLRFTSGADDIDFFRRAHERGARIVSVAEAIAVETVPASRLVLGRYLKRNFMVAGSNSFFGVLHDGRAKAIRRRLPGIVRRMAVGSTLVVSGACVWPIARVAGEKAIFRGASSLAKASGSLSGLFGRSSNYYHNIDGA